MTERTIKIKGLISGQVDMGTFGLVELELLAIEKEMEALRQPLVSGNEVALPFDKVTRLEVISYREGDKSGRVFTHWKDDNKIEGQLQDKDRTLKIFIDKR